MSSNAELHIKAQAVSRGISIGNAVCLYGRRRQYFRTKLDAQKIEKELRRFRAAVRLAVRQIGLLEPKSTNSSVDNAAGILEVHRMLLADEALLGEIEERIISDKVNAEWAVKLVTDGYLAQYRAIPDETLRERHVDLEDVTERLLTALGGGRRTHHQLESGSIVVAREINPSTLIELSQYEPAGIITEHGGWTSHTFILAREMGIPAVTGVRRALHRIRNGERAVIDGFRGEVILRPSGDTVESYNLETSAKPSVLSRPLPGELKTRDGRPITIRANADIPGGYERAKADGAKGVGLFRSEYIFNRFRGAPSESEQYEAYRRIAEMTGDEGVRIRTFDFGYEDQSEQLSTKCKNPALGLRAIRLSLKHESQFRDQLRAILRAAHGTRIDIILPMISDIFEVRRVKDLMAEERAALARRGIEAGSPRVGVMVEVPSAVLMIEELLDEAEVICLGTNDLVQYLLAVDRDNEDVAAWFRTLNPAVIRAVRSVLEACSKHGKPCVVCGEMAGSPYYVPILIGLGATELSMNPKSIRKIRSLISGIAFGETTALLRSIEKCRTAGEIEVLNREFIAAHWSHLYDDPPSIQRNAV